MKLESELQSQNSVQSEDLQELEHELMFLEQQKLDQQRKLVELETNIQEANTAPDNKSQMEQMLRMVSQNQSKLERANATIDK